MTNLQDRMALAKQHYERVHQKKLKNTEMAEYCKVSKVSIGQWFKGPTQNLEGANLSRAAEFLGVNHKWLAGGNAPMLTANPSKLSITIKSNSIDAPVLSMDQTQKWREYINGQITPEEYIATNYEGLDSKSVFMVKVVDQSMSPIFEVGDRLIIDPYKLPSPGGYVLALCEGDTVVFRRYRVTGYDDDGEAQFELIPHNNDFPVLDSQKHDIKVLGVVVRFTREL